MPKQRLSQTLAVCLSLGIVLVLAGCGGQPAAAPTLEPHALAPATPAEPTPSYVQQNRDDPRVAAIDGALKSAVQGREDIAAFLVNDVIIDHITSSDDGKLSLVWLALVD